MSFYHMFDLIIIILVLILGIKGIISGLVREIFGLIGIIGGIILATRFGTQMGAIISQKVYTIDSKDGAYFVGFIVVLICFWLLSLLLGKIFSKLLSMSGLGFLDKIGGFFIGSAKIFFVVCVILSVISNITVLNNKIQPYFKDSVIYPICLKTGKWILNIKTNSIKQDINNKLDTVQDKIESITSENNNSNSHLEQNITK